MSVVVVIVLLSSGKLCRRHVGHSQKQCVFFPLRNDRPFVSFDSCPRWLAVAREVSLQRVHCGQAYVQCSLAAIRCIQNFTADWQCAVLVGCR